MCVKCFDVGRGQQRRVLLQLSFVLLKGRFTKSDESSLTTFIHADDFSFTLNGEMSACTTIHCSREEFLFVPLKTSQQQLNGPKTMFQLISVHVLRCGLFLSRKWFTFSQLVSPSRPFSF